MSWCVQAGDVKMAKKNSNHDYRTNNFLLRDQLSWYDCTKLETKLEKCWRQKIVIGNGESRAYTGFTRIPNLLGLFKYCLQQISGYYFMD